MATVRPRRTGTPGSKIQNEEGTFGTVEIPDGSGGMRLPRNSRFVNPSAITFNLALGMEKDSWIAELFIDNLNNEDAPAAVQAKVDGLLAQVAPGLKSAWSCAPAVRLRRPGGASAMRLPFGFVSVLNPA